METNNLVKSYASKAAQTALFRSVYLWMTLALVITGFVAMYIAKSYTLIETIMQNSIMFWGLLIAEVGLVMYLSARIHKISFTTATLLFIAYSVLNGVTMSVLFLIYTLSSIATTFFSRYIRSNRPLRVHHQERPYPYRQSLPDGSHRTDYRFAGQHVPAQLDDGHDYFLYRRAALCGTDGLRFTKNQATLVAR